MTTYRGPGHVGIVGAGIVGLSTAWYLQEHGVRVTVIDSTAPAAGASWGNAGWITPSLAAPLPSPAMIRHGLAAALRPHTPVVVPLRPGLLPFLVRFALNGSTNKWEGSLRSLAWLSRQAIESVEYMASGDLAGSVKEAPILASFRSSASQSAFVAELEHMARCGQPMEYESLDATATRNAEPALSTAITGAVRVLGQRYIDPGPFCASLAQSVADRDGRLVRIHVASVQDFPTHARILDAEMAEAGRFDAVVLANGAELSRLAAPHGVRTNVLPGRGYSFLARPEPMPSGPLYFPTERIACTPVDGGMRVVGVMEFRRSDEPLDQRRVTDMRNTLAGLLAHDAAREVEAAWVGSRPCTPDGLPLIGLSHSPRVYIAGGHGMWGVSHAAATGKVIAAAMVSGRQPPELSAFDPLR